MKRASLLLNLILIFSLEQRQTYAQQYCAFSKNNEASSFAHRKNSDNLTELLKDLDLKSSFKENAGQWKSNILYQGSSEAANVYFLKNGISLCHTREEDDDDEHIEQNLDQLHSKIAEEYSYMVWNIYFHGMSKEVNIYGLEGSDSKTNYLVGSGAG